SRVKMLERLKPIAALVTDEVRPITIPEPEKLLSPPIIALDEVSVGYEPGRPILSDLSARIDNDDRIALLGSNGNGKSTFVKLIAQRLAPFGGTVTRAEKLKVAYFAQHQLDELDLEGTPYSHIRKLVPDETEAKVRARVGAIGFSGQAADTKVEKLSGGEKARLMLGLATFGGPHLLILDEPTNHLDIDSRAALIEAINDFSGAVILVSHDRHLLAACADRLWLVSGGEVHPFEGDLDDYRRQILKDRDENGAERSAKNSPGARSEKRKAAAEKRADTAPLRQRVQRAEASIKRLTAEIERLDRTLAEAGLFIREPARGAALAKERADTAAALARAEEEWLEASAAFDAPIA
ncbi:MAG: ATP-binding cassette domain-containing protein, partial [Pseudolabrys sp.]|nr:ATP-binding cassette domain-containing protein [Pseudolabrys sp.]